MQILIGINHNLSNNIFIQITMYRDEWILNDIAINGKQKHKWMEFKNFCLAGTFLCFLKIGN